VDVAAVHADVVVATSRIYRTTCTLVRRGGEAFCVDSPILPDELELLPTVAEQSGFGVVALLATHSDWDHLLGRLAFAEAPLGVAESTAAVLDENPGAAQRGLRAFDEEHYVVRATPLALGTAQRLPVPGRLGLGDAELDLHPVAGHTPDGMAIAVPWASVLIVGDHLSPVEIPMVGEAPGSLDAYLATLDRLEPLVTAAATVIPGHGEPLESERALAILREDRDYLRALAATGAAAPLPMARRTEAQKAVHHANVGRVVPA
jgi:glyoxylase-like metal-dependent hydrolase (beta-lactamase superfamily II)